MLKNKWFKFCLGAAATVTFVAFGSLGISALVGAGLISALLSMLLGVVSGAWYATWYIERFDLF